MKKRMIEVICPFCSHSFWMLRDTMILMDESSVEHQRLMESGYFWHQCQNCHHLFELSYPFLIRDTGRDLSLVLLEQGDLPEFDGGKTVRMRTPADFQFVYQAVVFDLPLHEAGALRRLLYDQGYSRLKILSVDQSQLLIEADGRILRLNRTSERQIG